MRSGLLTEVIKIKRPRVTKNKYGEKVQEYVDHYLTRARVVFNHGSRLSENGEILHEYTKTLELWQYVDVVETDLVEMEEKLYRILSIEHDKKQQKKVLIVELVNE